MSLITPESLAASCAKSQERATWLNDLPNVIDELVTRWSITAVNPPFDGEDVSCAWVALVTCAQGPAVLKIGMPHMEAEHEIAGLRLLDGDPTIALLEWDDEHHAMLLERCEPGTSLRSMFQPDQDVVIAGLLKRFWRALPDDHGFRPLSAMIDFWIDETRAQESRWYDRQLVTDGLRAFEFLARSSDSNMLLATDLHAGNVLASRREPWLVIDPKPFAGDTSFDATQHLLNCRSRLRTDGIDTIRRIADLFEVDFSRVHLWTFARLAAEPRDEWDDEPTELARLIARGL